MRMERQRETTGKVKKEVESSLKKEERKDKKYWGISGIKMRSIAYTPYLAVFIVEVSLRTLNSFREF